MNIDINEIIVLNEFCDHYEGLLEESERADFDTEIFQGVEFYDIAHYQSTEWAQKKLEQMLRRPIEDIKCFFRLYRRGIAQNTFIHEDSVISTHSAILSIQLPGVWNGSLAFWEPFGPESKHDNEHDWRLIKEVDLVNNCCVIFPSKYWHSRMPQAWKKHYPRAIMAMFFNIP